MSKEVNKNHVYQLSENDRLRRISTYCSFSAVIIIIIIKVAGWILTNSLAMFASLTDSLLDAVTSFLNILAVSYAIQPPDNEHRFGHGKAEDLAVFVQSAFFSVSGIFLAIAAVKRMFLPQSLEHDIYGIIIMCCSIAITLIVIVIQRYVIKKTGSNLIKADYLHYSVDLLANLAVIISIVIGSIWHTHLADPIFALIISGYILQGAWELLQRAFKNLMDHELADEQKEKIISIVRGHPEVKGLHDLKTRYAGTKPFIQFHLELDGDMKLRQAHGISDLIEAQILEKFPEAEIIIHQDPEDLEERVDYKDKP